jgi:DNA-binding NarL/FixJ family response regulator
MRFLLIDEDASYRKAIRYHIEVEWPDASIDEIAPQDEVRPAPHDAASYDLILLGYPAIAERGLEWLKHLARPQSAPPIIVFADPSDEFMAVDALQAGAASYFPKPRVTHHRLISVLHQALHAAGTPGYTAPLVSPRATLVTSSRYRYLKTLHAGDLASVYLAEANGAKEQLAFKVIRYVPDQGSERLFDRFLQEYEIIAALEHPNVVRIFDLGVADDHAFIAMEYLAAGSLAARLNAPLAPLVALGYARQIASALDAIHSTGILHRDLKPANIMFRDDETLALIDFGLAKQMRLEAALTGAGQIFGTPYYMSPEQGHAEATDQRSDLYSLGCIFYEMLTGQRPFMAGTAMGVIYKHANAERPRLGPGLMAFQDVLDKLLAPKPAARFADAGDVFAALGALTS